MTETNPAGASGPSVRCTKPCQWCGRPVPQRFPVFPKLHCDTRHWISDVRANFWRRFWDNL
ncbi:hypothetical protein [Streptomyces sp. NBC_01244]|uniref:hypothetical protein n=1 Tax=Streptomyces sp. NBC_01244 TaxID=2903797 RepID=UPI002E13D8E9|nr:hypothetical protein OG247_00710 [Streptomyces sp. NBC_01244]